MARQNEAEAAATPMAHLLDALISIKALVRSIASACRPASWMEDQQEIERLRALLVTFNIPGAQLDVANRKHSGSLRIDRRTIVCVREVAVAFSAEYQIGTSMRKTVIVVASLASALCAKADYVIKQTIENAGKSRAFEIKIKDTKLRIDTANQNSAIFDSKTGEETILLHQQKAFVKISSEQLKSRTEAMKRTLKISDENPANIELKPTGKKETILGYEAEEYATTVGGVPTSVFVAKNYPNYQKFLEALSTAHKASALQSSLSVPPEKYPGMPLRTEIELKGQKLTTTLNSAEETTIPDDEFTVPTDYKEMSSPQLQEK